MMAMSDNYHDDDDETVGKIRRLAHQMFLQKNYSNSENGDDKYC